MYSDKIITTILLAISGLLYYFYLLRKKSDSGGGGGGGAMFSKGPVLTTYTRDLSADAEQEKLDPVIGREEEVDRVIHILARRSKNNPLLLGEPGVGKTAIVEGIARKIARGDVPGRLRNKKVLALELGGLISGTKYRGEFEERMKKLTEEIKGMGRVIILFIDEIHMIEQAKGAEGAMNVSDILKPALSRGELQAIGATTLKEYAAYIKPDDALNRRFQPVIVGEPSQDATLAIMRGIKGLYEEHHGVLYDDDALKASVKLSSQYIHDRFLPDKAIDLLDEAGAKVSIEASHNSKHAKSILQNRSQQTRAQLAFLHKERMQMSEEEKRFSRIAEAVKDPELEDIRNRIGHFIGEIDKIDKRIRQKSIGKIPRVRVGDIKEVVDSWVGKKV